jgi:hypothetical protein
MRSSALGNFVLCLSKPRPSHFDQHLVKWLEAQTRSWFTLTQKRVAPAIRHGHELAPGEINAHGKFGGVLPAPRFGIEGRRGCTRWRGGGAGGGGGGGGRGGPRQQARAFFVRCLLTAVNFLGCHRCDLYVCSRCCNCVPTRCSLAASGLTRLLAWRLVSSEEGSRIVTAD